MSKGNMLLGYARGKVGDVVFSRLNGQQITRARNRSPKNPRTAAQMAQRAIMSTLGKAYSAGKEIFDHAFEGLKVGTENQSEFMKLNTNLFRNILVDELNDPPVRNNGISLVGPGSAYPVPGRYIVSRGSYDQSFFRFQYADPVSPATNSILQLGVPFYLLKSGQAEKLGDYMARNGLIVGDLYTFVFFMSDNSSDTSEPACLFGFVRVRVSPTLDMDDGLDDETLGSVFTAVSSYGIEVDDFLNTMFESHDSAGTMWQSIRSYLFPSDSDFDIDSIACIRSHELSGKRSNSQMMWVSTENHPRYNSRDYVEAWQAISESITDPALLLEGAKVDAGPII